MLSLRVSIERNADIQAAHFHTSTIKLRTLKDTFCGRLELHHKEDTDVLINGYQYM
mgnify:CR=1 FL=1